jgi:hypothetical protein
LWRIFTSRYFGERLPFLCGTRIKFRVTAGQGEVKQAASQLQMMEFTANVEVDECHPHWMITVQNGRNSPSKK